jgi:hypothetical protein
MEVSMKLPSIQQVLQESNRTLQRFPFVIACAVVGTMSALALADYDTPPASSVLFNILAAALIGIPFLLAIALFAESGKWSRLRNLGAQSLGVIILAAYGSSIPSALIGAPLFHLFRLQMLANAALFLVTVAPYIGSFTPTGFWHFNKTLFLRLLIATLFSQVLYIGLAVALAALQNLFGLDVPGRRYFQLWIVVTGVFGIWFFLSGVPDDVESLEASTDYPGSIKVFAQYILLPVVFVYFVILYAYLGKILIEWNWPRGWVSGLILGFSSTGLATLLLLYPVRERAENVWIRFAWRWFFIVLIPLIVVLFLAILRRVSDYGITEPRYIAIVYGIWLVAMIAYFTLGKTKNIRVISGSLCVVALLISFGPWGAFQVSQKSQIARLKGLLVRDSILVNDTVQKAPESVSAEDRSQISAVIGYLHKVHGYDGIQPWFRESLMQDSLGTGSTYKDPIFVTQMMGIVYDPYWQGTGGNAVSLRADQSRALSIDGYQHLLPTRSVFSGSAGKVYPADGISYRIGTGLDTVTFYLTRDDGATDSLQISLRPLVDKLVNSHTNISEIPPEEMSVTGTLSSFKVKIGLQRIQLRRIDGEMKPISYEAEILYSIGDRGE